MNLTKDEIDNLIAGFAGIVRARAKELELSADGEAEHASPSLVEAQATTSAVIDAFKNSIATKIRSGGYTIVQEGGALSGAEDEITMPASIDCTCG